MKDFLNWMRVIYNKRFIVPILTLLIACSIFLFVWIFGVNVLYLDEWFFASLVKKFQSGGLDFAFLFSQHNEHRIFFPNLFYLVLLPISHMNSKVIMFVNAILVCIEFCCFYLIAKKQFKFSFSEMPAWLLVVPLFVFNFRQWQDLIWAFQLAFYMVLIFSILSLYLLDKLDETSSERWRIFFFFIANLSAIIATFSSAMGFLVWIAGGVQLIIGVLNKKYKQIIVYTVVWIIVGLISIMIYNKGLNSSIGQNLQFAIRNPIVFIHFFFSLISLISVHSLSIIAFPIGLLLFLISIYVFYNIYKNNRWSANKFWIGIYTFSFLFSVLTTIGRCPIAFEYTDRSRYTIFTSLLVISTFVMFLDCYRVSIARYGVKIFKFFFVLLLILGVGLDAIGIAFGVKQKQEREKIRLTILNYKEEKFMTELKGSCAWCDNNFFSEIIEYTPFLEENHYNVFTKNVKSNK
ncbi:MAG TPA: hypothetical protein VIH57_14340 [Bacteroidales bacterium]